MEEISITLITLGGLFLVGLLTDLLGRHTALPRVTFLLILGFLIGPSALGILPDLSERWFPIVTNMALVMIGFLLGGKLTLETLKQHGRSVLGISVGVALITALVVLTALLLVGVRPEIALLLAGIATSTAPIATVDVVHEARAEGVFTRTLLGIVALDDAWGLIVFSLMLAAVQVVSGYGDGGEAIIAGAWELGGAVFVGIALGVPMAYLTGRIQPGEPTLAEALGVVLLCGGIAIWLEVSFLLAAMVLGFVVANLARHHSRPFHAIEGIEWPFMILFFLLAGASLHVQSLAEVGLIGAIYIVCRIIGRFLGTWVGGTLSHAAPTLRRWMGMALLPQAGVALGMALVATQRFPQFSETIFPVVIGATVLFEVIGPILTRRALVHVGDIRSK
ncbi:MAG: cation:proton antiporter [Acidiferrobacterales bacterium]